MPAVSEPVNAAALLSDFVQIVKNPVMQTASTWHSGNPPSASHAGHRLLGPRAEPNPSWPSQVGTITATNVFYILHSFAVALTRHRMARGFLATDGGGYVDLGFALTSYAQNNTIWFNFPSIPAVGTPLSSSQMTNFLNALRQAVLAIKTNNNYASDLFAGACHSSCHSSCHGARGRR